MDTYFSEGGIDYVIGVDFTLAGEDRGDDQCDGDDGNKYHFHQI